MHFGVAVVGLGGMGMHHYQATLANSSCEIIYLVEQDEEKLRDLDSIACKTTDIQRVLNDENVDMVCIASYDDVHYEQIVKSINARKHVFVEKPLCQTKQELENIVNLLKENRCALSSNLVLRTAPLYNNIRDLIINDALGEIYAFDGDYLYGRLHKITTEWRKDVKDYSVMEGGGIHMVDLMLWLTGRNPTSVISHRSKIVTKDSSFRYHDFQSSVFKFESGLIGRITANFGCVHNHQHVMRIFGSKGTFIYDDAGARIHWSRDPEKNIEYVNFKAKPENKAELLHDFVQAISDNNFAHLAEREFDLMSVVLAADEALDKTIEIEYIKC
jgi:predicted dehydrogenase